METISKTVFKTSDGKEFDDELDACAHEAKLQHGSEIQIYIDTEYPKISKAGRTRKAKELARFEAFKLLRRGSKAKAA